MTKKKITPHFLKEKRLVEKKVKGKEARFFFFFNFT